MLIYFLPFCPSWSCSWLTSSELRPRPAVRPEESSSCFWIMPCCRDTATFAKAKYSGTKEWEEGRENGGDGWMWSGRLKNLLESGRSLLRLQAFWTIPSDVYQVFTALFSQWRRQKPIRKAKLWAKLAAHCGLCCFWKEERRWFGSKAEQQMSFSLLWLNIGSAEAWNGAFHLGLSFFLSGLEPARSHKDLRFLVFFTDLGLHIKTPMLANGQQSFNIFETLLN